MSVTLAFALTFEKCQGCTVDRAVIVLEKKDSKLFGNMKLDKVYVALSRVRNGKHYAIIGDKINYLTKLKYPTYIHNWRNNYDEDGKWLKRYVWLC